MESSAGTADSTRAIPTDPLTSATNTTTSMLECCNNGNLSHLKDLLVAHAKTESLPSAHDMLMRACNARQPHIVQFIVERFSDIQPSLELHSAAFSGGVDVYSIILNEFPKLKDHSFGHTSDPISQAVLNGDTVMLDFVLGQGFNVKNSHYCYVPVCQPCRSFKITEEGIFSIELIYCWDHRS